MAIDAIQVESSRGRLTAEFALNGWVLLECGDRSGQFRVFKKSELAAVLRSEHAFRDDEADEVAAAIWRARPRGSAMRDSDPEVWATNRSMFRETGMPWWAVLLIAVGFVGLIALFVVLVLAVGQLVT